MAIYHFHPAALGEVLALPAGVADGLRLATKEQLQVLLWFAAHHQQWDEAACATALGLTPAESRSCLQFWLDKHILMEADAFASATAGKLPRPAPVKPRVQEVLAYQKTHPDFSAFLEAVSATLGKPLTHGDTATLVYLLDTVGLSGETVLLIIAYAMSIGKGNLRYIEKLTLDWADEDITSFEAVNDRIRRLETCRRAATRVETLLQLPTALTVAQSEMAHRWLEEWHFSDDMLKRAAVITTDKTGKVTPGYMNRILERWHIEGIDSPDKILAPAPPAAKKKVAATNPEQTSLDVEGFEQSLRRYRPKFKVPEDDK